MSRLNRAKIALGDCVSINSSYFGEVYAKEVGVQRLIGRVTKVVDNQDFDVTWDIDSDDDSKHLNLDQVWIEAKDTPTQQLEEFTADNHLVEQGSSTDARSSHALLVEEFDIPADDYHYFLLANDQKIFRAKKYSSPPGTKIHHRQLLDNELKFEIVEVLYPEWEDLNKDKHCVGSFIAWCVDDTVRVEHSTQRKKKKFQLKVDLKEAGRETDEDEDEVATESNESSGEEYIQKVMKVGGKCKPKRGKQKAKVSNKSEKGKSLLKRINAGQKAAKKKPKLLGKSKNEKDQITINEKEESKDNTNKRKRSLGNTNSQGGKKKKEEVCKNKRRDRESSCSSSSESEEESKEEKTKKEKLKEQKETWSAGGWPIDPCTSHAYGPRLNLDDYDILDELAYLLHQLPVKYIKEVIITASNNLGLSYDKAFKIIEYEEFLIFLGLVYSMEVFKLPERRMYWRDNESDLFPNMDFGKHMSRERFEEILSFLQFSHSDNKDQQILDFLEAVNENLKSAVSPGLYVCIDESMIKAFHHDLPGKIKIKRKPRPIGNEIKDLSDASSMIVVHMELYEGKGPMASKEYVPEFGATCATTLRLVRSIAASGRIVIGDSWFGSVKTAVQLRKQGLFAIMLVKTNHALYPKELLDSHQLSRGKWVGYTKEVDGVKVMAVGFQDLKKKHFIATCESVVAGNPCVTKHHGDVPRPKVAETYLRHADSIDKHNSFRTGSLGLEDVLHTHSPHLRQAFGIFGFLFTNAYLAYRFFKPDQSNLKHVTFKMTLAEKLVKVAKIDLSKTRSSAPASVNNSAGYPACVNNAASHIIAKLAHQAPCYYCRHGYKESSCINTSFKCETCGVPMHKPFFVQRKKDGTKKVLDCWNLHLIHGKPVFRRAKKNE